MIVMMKRIGLMAMLVACALPLRADIIFNPGDSLDEFSAAGFAAGDFTVTADGGGASGLAGDTAVQFVTRTTNSHTMQWNQVDGAVVSAADTLTLDIRNVVALGTATLSVNVYYDGVGTPHAGYNGTLLTDNFESIVVSMPTGGTHTLDRIDFAVLENVKIIQVDNLTLTTVPEPASLALVGLGGLAMLPRRKR